MKNNQLERTVKSMISQSRIVDEDERKVLFENFIVGEFNQSAYQKAQEIINNSDECRFLILSGNTGRGKTYLLEMIGSAVLNQEPSKNIVYMEAKRFCESDTLFEDKDVFLIDSIEEVLDLEPELQDKFVDVLQEIRKLNKRIILAINKYSVSDVQNFNEKLGEFLLYGYESKIGILDDETCVKILKDKIKTDGLEKYHISDSVLEYIVQYSEPDILILKGILNKIVCMFQMEEPESKKIDMEFVERLVASKKIAFDRSYGVSIFLKN